MLPVLVDVAERELAPGAHLLAPEGHGFEVVRCVLVLLAQVLFHAMATTRLVKAAEFRTEIVMSRVILNWLCGLIG